jgi:hypothetical protein
MVAPSRDLGSLDPGGTLATRDEVDRECRQHGGPDVAQRSRDVGRKRAIGEEHDRTRPRHVGDQPHGEDRSDRSERAHGSVTDTLGRLDRRDVATSAR